MVNVYHHGACSADVVLVLFLKLSSPFLCRNDVQAVAEHAWLAAQAIMQAEEASRKASSLLEAAHQLYELENPLYCEIHRKS